MNIEQQLRSTSDSILATLEQLEALENEKRNLKPDSPRFQRLATEIERLAASVFAHTHAQQQLAEKSRALVERTGADVAPIEEVAAARDLQTILADWRAAERRLADADPDSAERTQAAADVGRLRAEYQRAYSGQSGEPGSSRRTKA